MIQYNFYNWTQYNKDTIIILKVRDKDKVKRLHEILLEKIPVQVAVVHLYKDALQARIELRPSPFLMEHTKLYKQVYDICSVVLLGEGKVTGEPVSTVWYFTTNLDLCDLPCRSLIDKE